VAITAIKNVVLVTPSLTAGGAEKVIAQLANEFSQFEELNVTVITLIKDAPFYHLNSNIKLVQPEFDHRQYSRLVFTLKTFRYLRSALKQTQPRTVLSFGGKYNAFVLLASRGLRIPVFISDRSRPTISYGKLLNVLNRFVYKSAHGIIAQTEQAREVLQKRLNHRNIAVIGNPIKIVNRGNVARENIVLNVGRFIPSKHQDLLIEYFADLKHDNWKLVLIGDGPQLERCKKIAIERGIENKVVFAGVTQDINQFYSRAKIFAFTSSSEGFPNVLAEALSTPLASISFDCMAGPSDLIENNVNGYLVKEFDHHDYKVKLKHLLNDSATREEFEAVAIEKIQKFESGTISKEYLKFLFQDQ
jgi:GalNAc-alpha-(1->4)-GalNAc-alpha-(1->3)-diNAcBac-PP-undecaprenol alpha-1,4-N-acetyl-D-galactosaminyltransferase